MFKQEGLDVELDSEVSQATVNLRKRELRKHPEDKYLIRPRDLSLQETYEVF